MTTVYQNSPILLFLFLAILWCSQPNKPVRQPQMYYVNEKRDLNLQCKMRLFLTWLIFALQRKPCTPYDTILLNYDVDKFSLLYRYNSSKFCSFAVRKTKMACSWQAVLKWSSTVYRRDLRPNKLTWSDEKPSEQRKRISNREQLCLILRHFTSNSLEICGKTSLFNEEWIYFLLTISPLYR